MGSNLQIILDHLYICEKQNKTPLIFWGKDSYYYTEEGFNGFKNCWEYYFEPVSSLKYKDLNEIKYQNHVNCRCFSYHSRVCFLIHEKNIQSKKFIDKLKRHEIS